MICNKCGVDKPETDFPLTYRVLGQRRKVCRLCKNTVYQRQWYLKHRAEHVARTYAFRKKYRKLNRQFLHDYFTIHHCEVCGFDNPAALDFHHKDPKEKGVEIAKMRNGSYSLEYAKKEVAKCIVLCANHHRILTAKEYGWYKDLV